MDSVISFTPAQLVAFITAIGGAIVSIGAVATLIFKLVNRVKAPEAEQNRRIKALEDENKEMKGEIEKLKIRLDDGNGRFEGIEKANRVILRSLQALLAQSLGADATEALKEAKTELDNYFLEK